MADRLPADAPLIGATRRTLQGAFVAALTAAVLALGVLSASAAASSATPTAHRSTEAIGLAAASRAFRPGEIAVVGSEAITKAQLDSLLSQARATYVQRRQAFPAAGTAAYKTVVRQAIGVLIQRAEYAQRVRQMGIVVTEAQVQQQLDQFKKQSFGGDEKAYRAQLDAQGLTDLAVHDQIRANLIAQAIDRRLAAGIVLRESEVKAYYNAHKAQFSKPPTRAVSQILVASRALADKLHTQLANGADFAALAKTYSIDPASAAQGGKLTIARGQTVTAFERVAFALKAGQISPPIQTQYGWHIIKADGPVKPGSAMTLAQAQKAIRGQLLQERKTASVRDWIKQTTAMFASRIRYAPGYPPS